MCSVFQNFCANIQTTISFCYKKTIGKDKTKIDAVINVPLFIVILFVGNFTRFDVLKLHHLFNKTQQNMLKISLIASVVMIVWVSWCMTTSFEFDVGNVVKTKVWITFFLC